MVEINVFLSCLNVFVYMRCMYILQDGGSSVSGCCNKGIDCFMSAISYASKEPGGGCFEIFTSKIQNSLTSIQIDKSDIHCWYLGRG